MTDRLDKSTPVYMIFLPDSEVSCYYADICKSRWEEFGYSVTLIDGFTPLSLTREVDNKFAEEVHYFDRTNTPDLFYPFTDTMKASFWSHFNLWKNLCVRNVERAIIIEHDCYLNYDLPNTVFDNDIYFFAQAYGTYVLQIDTDSGPVPFKVKARSTKMSTGYAATRSACFSLESTVQKILDSSDENEKIDLNVRHFLQKHGHVLNPDYRGVFYPNLEDQKIGLYVPPEVYWNKTIFATELRDPLKGRTVDCPLPEV